MVTRGVRSWWIKAVIVVAMVLLFVPSVKVHAAESSGRMGDNLTWTLTDEGVLTISGTGELLPLRGWIEGYEDKVKQVIIQNGIESIGSETFRNSKSLTSVTIPDSVTNIGSTAFMDCHNLSSITIPNSVTNIGDFAFQGCSKLSGSVTIPNSVTSIGFQTFASCGSLSSITIPNSVTSIGDGAFRSCRSLSSITIPNSVTSIGDGAFTFCGSLSSITIPNSVISIGDGAFSYCSSLSSITISNSVTNIGNETFKFCEALRSVVIPNSVTSIGEDAFIWHNFSAHIHDVYYEGTEAQWNAISIASGNLPLKYATIHFIQPVDREQVESFVSRMYTIILERNPEAKGLQEWTNQLVTRQIDGASFSNGIVMSQEYTNKNDSDESYVNKLYRTFLNREADEGGFDSWVTQLKRGYSRKSVLAGFVNSEEFTQICASYGIDRGTMTLTEQESARSDDNLHIDSEQVKAYVTRLYDKILGREPDEEGFNNWVNSITSRQQNAAVVAKIGFFESQEYANKNRTNEEFVTDCYRSLMGREPDEGGFIDWTGRLSRGEMTRAEVIETGFGQSQEFANILRGYGLKMAE